MHTTHADQFERALDSTWRTGEPPALTRVDRAALRLGLGLILWSRRHAGPLDREAQARRFAADRATAAARDAFERRVLAGPTRW